MSAVGIAALGVSGLALGNLLVIGVERIPARQPLLAARFPELARAWRDPMGLVVVLATAGLFSGLAARIGDEWELPAYLVLAAGLVLLSAIDLRHYVLPNRIVLPLAVISLALLGIAAVANHDGDAFLRALGCGAGAFVAFLLLHLVSPRAMGFGDVKLAFVLGLDLGWLGVGETILGLFLGFVYGAIIGVLLIATRLRSRKDHVPFGPFLAAGTLTAVLIDDVILDWYRS